LSAFFFNLKGLITYNYGILLAVSIKQEILMTVPEKEKLGGPSLLSFKSRRIYGIPG